MSAPNTRTPASSPTTLDTDATVYMVKVEGYWRAKIVNNRTGEVVWSEQTYDTREDCQQAFDQTMQELGITQHRYQ